MSDPAQEVVKSRENSHGNYVAQAMTAQALKDVLRKHPRWSYLVPAQQESLEMIMMKISRILHGNSAEPDHWLDISGYSMLIYNWLNDLEKGGL